MFIPDATIKQILDKADIVAIIGEHIKLEKKGNDFKGICPFHDDSNPSMSVSPNKKIFKCFSCGETGNAITFVQKFKHITFPEAVKLVGEKCGVEVELSKNSNQQNYQKYYKILQDATSYYEFYLKNSIEGKNALNYLHNRKLNDAIIKRFKIGLASKERSLLYEALTKRENPYLPLDLKKCGLINSSKQDDYFDVFRDRIIFPIDDFNGNIVGFSGRIYTEDKKNEPKYMNTSENEIFKKGNILYNYSYAANDIKKKNRIYIFEGFMDVIAAYRANVLNTVATMGTALTESHIRAIKKLTSNIVLCFDGDIAGITATKRAMQMFLKENMDVRVMLLPEGMDPDEYLDKYGEASLKEFLETKSISGIDYLYSLELRKLNKNDINSVENFKKNIFGYLKMFNSKSVEAMIVKKMSSDLELKSEDLSKDFSSMHETVVDFGPVETKPTKKVFKQKYLIAENNLIYLALQKKEYCDKIARLLPFEKSVYVKKENREIFWSIFDYYHINPNLDYDHFYHSSYLNDKMKEQLDEVKNSVVLCDENFIETFIEENANMVLKYCEEKKLEMLEKPENIDENHLRIFSELKKKTIKIKK